MFRGLIKVYEKAYTKQDKGDKRKPYERFMDWYSKHTKVTKIDKFAFGFLLNFVPMYLKAFIIVAIMGLLWGYVAKVGSTNRLIISVGLTLFLFLYFRFEELNRKIGNQEQ